MCVVGVGGSQVAPSPGVLDICRSRQSSRSRQRKRVILGVWVREAMYM